MRAKICAALMLVIVIVFSTVNTVVLNSMITEILNDVESLDCESRDLLNAEAIYENFTKYETYVSITVSHEDLTNIESSFSELVGYLSVGDSEGARVVKRRLTDALEHLRRLSGINIDAII